MITIAILIGILVLLFAGAFISKRRFGLLGLALTAGATISTIWADTAGLMVSATGLIPHGPITEAVTLSLVVLLPAILLLFHGYKYKNVIARVIGSFCFAVLALVFLIEPLSHVLVLEGTSAEIYRQILYYKDVVISVGVILAVVDIFLTKPVHAAEKAARKHK